MQIVILKKSTSESDFTVRIIRQQYSKKCYLNNKFNKSAWKKRENAVHTKTLWRLNRDWVWFLIHIHDKL